MRLPARLGACACLGVAVAMAALSLRDTARPDPVPRALPEAVTVADPLQARLLRCQQAGEAAAAERDCLAAWAENRRRFLGLGGVRGVDPDPSPPTSHIPSPAARPADTAPAAAQPQEH